MNEKVLFVDDDPNILAAYTRQLKKVLSVETAVGGQAALKLMAETGPFAVVVADMMMPGMDGIQFLMRAKEHAPDTVRMMLTGHANIQTAVEAVNEGNIFRFLTKPCPAEALVRALADGISQYRLVTGERSLLENTLNGSIQLLTEVLSMVDPDAFGRAMRLREIVQPLAIAMGITDTWDIELAAMFSQIGFVTIPSEVAEKCRAGEALDAAEEEMILCVPETGEKLLANIPRLETVAQMVLYQNKSYDGSGFPRDEVAENHIPLGSRILKAVADLSDITDSGATRQEAVEQMREQRGRYDPAVLEAIAALPDEDSSEGEASSVKVLEVPVADLHIGDVLAADLQTVDGRLLIATGNEVTQVVMARLGNYAKVVEIQQPVRIMRRAVARR